MAPKQKQPVDWRTVNLKDFSNVVFKESANMKSASLAVIKNAAGKYLEFVSPKMRTFGLSYNEYDGKPSYSVSLAFSDNDTEEVVAFRKFLEDLYTHTLQFCEGGKKSEPLVQYPKVKDTNRPGEFLKQGKEYLRDTTRPPTVRYKIYPERNQGVETGCIDVRLYNKKMQPLFHYGNAESDEHFRNREIPERTCKAEMDAIEKGCMIRVLCTARLSSTFDGAIFYAALTATQIKRVSAGVGAPNADDTADFGDDGADDDDEEVEDAAAPLAVAVPAKRLAITSQEDDGIEDELDNVVAAVVVPPPAAAAVPASKKRTAEAIAPPPEQEENEEEEEVAAVVVPPPTMKKRKLTVPK